MDVLHLLIAPQMIVYMSNAIVGRRHASAVAEGENAEILADSRRREHALALQYDNSLRR